MKVGRIVDLSHRVDEHTQVYPGDPRPRFEPATTIAVEGANVLSVHLGSHSGTHVDAPYHFVERGERIDAMDPKLFVGPAVVMDVRGKELRSRIGVEDLQPYEGELTQGAIAVLHTGWDEHYGTPLYYDHPFLDRRAAQLILDSRCLLSGSCPQLLDLPLRTTQHPVDVKSVGVGRYLRRDAGGKPHHRGR